MGLRGHTRRDGKRCDADRPGSLDNTTVDASDPPTSEPVTQEAAEMTKSARARNLRAAQDDVAAVSIRPIKHDNLARSNPAQRFA